MPDTFEVLGLLGLGALAAYGVYRYTRKPSWQPGQPRPVGANGIGDLNGDGFVGPDDIADIERIILELNDPSTGQPYSAEKRRRADANGDGKVDMGDVVKIERYYLGLDNTLPYERLTKAQQWGLVLKYHKQIFHAC